MISEAQLRALVRLGMKYSNDWALYKLVKYEYIDGVILKLEFRRLSRDSIQKIIHIYPNGGTQ